MPILDVYVPAPGNLTGANPTYDRGKALGLYIKLGEDHNDDYTSLYLEQLARGETMLRALSWNFPDDESLKSADNQFMLGPLILIMPVLFPLLRACQGVFVTVWGAPACRTSPP
ncbi:glycoside hydrolase family 31 protein [Macroventuria anomochaeta]|uniref:Glycoside hydrolase family 31 protein n=1 Tax=Macroventuria anomochaeta TaxID=301207 RepID=A0ACB6SFT6_9PLEO|nr:glycoside hydrolase family 31 protein [Macroventuria anomochaeta]KAF2633140.1 glycoside hydrolase family 31 protein [Macroventuria anomochaeta]